MAFSPTASAARAYKGATTAMGGIIGKGVAMPGGTTKAAMGGAAATKAGGFMGSMAGFGPILAIILAEMFANKMVGGIYERKMLGAQTESLGRMGEMMTPQAAMYEEIGPAVDTQLQMTMANLAQLLGPQNRLASGEEFIGGR